MTDQLRELYRVWTMRLSVVTTLIVVLLSWGNEVKTLQLIVRAGVAFGVMYFLLVGTLSLFNKTATKMPQEKPVETKVGPGGVIDFAVGDDEPQNLQVQESRFPGQVDQNLSSGLPDSEQQAEIVRRMGWD